MRSFVECVREGKFSLKELLVTKARKCHIHQKSGGKEKYC